VNKARYEVANQALATAGSVLTGLDGALSNAESATVQYSLEKGQKKMWNFIVGGQFQLNEHWMVRAEYGFLGTRNQFIGGLQYRFGI
jgi:opacity protein-like surface antigen